jgi:hypothetical protein
VNDELENYKKYVSQDIRSPGQDLNPGLPEYEAVVLTTWQCCSVLLVRKSFRIPGIGATL